jgi:hypothetical protein
MIELVYAVIAKFKCHDVTIFMKSGNCIKLDSVKTCSYTPDQQGINSLRLNQSTRAKNYLLVKSICLEQVEAIATSRTKLKLPWG